LHQLAEWAADDAQRIAHALRAYLLDRLQACDLVLVKGFKSRGFPMLEVWRESEGKPMISPSWPGILAVASDGSRASTDILHLDLMDTKSIADFVLENAAQR